MEVILLKAVEKLGKRGEVVTVRDGYGRNLLFPRSLALPATRQNRAFLETQKLQAAKRKNQKREEAQTLAERFQSLKLRIEVTAGEKDKLFGSVTSQDVAEALAQKGISIDKKRIHLPEPIRSLGKHTVSLELESEVKAPLQVEIIKNAQSGVKS